MDATTELLKDYLFNKGIQLKNLSEKANIPYSTLRDVFCNKKSSLFKAESLFLYFIPKPTQTAANTA